MDETLHERIRKRLSVIGDDRQGRVKRSLAPTSGLNVTIGPLRFDGSGFSLFLAQNSTLTVPRAFDRQTLASLLCIRRQDVDV